MGKAERLFACLVHRFPMKELDSAEFVAERGLKGCIHGRLESKRQVLLMDAETLQLLGVAPGMVKENITSRGLDLKQISEGRRLRVGEAVLEATIPCDPCDRMEEIRAGLREELRGRRGWLFRVIEGGVARPGDSIEILPDEAMQNPVQGAKVGDQR
jgi:MOSC domain-containing protein YiiM